MAQLNDSVVSGNLRVTDETLTDTLQATKIKVPTTSGGTTYGVGSNGQVIKSNGTSSYWSDDSGNTTYTLDRNGENVRLTPSSGTAQNVSLSSLINGLGEGTSPAQANDYAVVQYAGGGTSNTTYYRRKLSNVVNKTIVDTALGKGSDTTKYYRNDGTWSVPPGEANVQSDWSVTDNTSDAFIKNKPTLGTASAKDVPTSGNASTTQVVMGDDTRLTNSRTPTSHTHGNIQNTGVLQQTDITIASGDKLVVTDTSDSNKVARTSVSFDGSTATKCLTQKGTWESFTNNTGTVTGSGTSGQLAKWNTSTGLTSTAYSEVTIPNVTGVGSAPSLSYEEVTVPNVTSVGSMTTVSVTGTTLNIINGSAPTLGTALKPSKISSWSAGSTPTLGTSIKATKVT